VGPTASSFSSRLARPVDLRVRIMWTGRVAVRTLCCASDRSAPGPPGSAFPSSLAPASSGSLTALARVAPDDAPQRCIGFQRGPINTDGPALDQARIGQRLEHLISTEPARHPGRQLPVLRVECLEFGL
jgi:hypothetical protein